MEDHSNLVKGMHTFFFSLQLEKVLQQGDIGECAEPYLKEDKVSTVDFKKRQYSFEFET